MNCIKCGAPLVEGQTICSNCGTTNSNNDYFSQYSSQNIYQNNQYNQSNQYNQNNNNDIYQENHAEQKNIKRQNIFLKVASIFALISGVGMLVMSISNIFITTGLNRFNITYLLGFLISVLFVFYAFLLSNFNIGKNKLFDNKVLFIVFLFINAIAAFVYNIYFIVLILGVIGFIISLKRKG